MTELVRRLRDGESVLLKGGYRISYGGGLYWLHLLTVTPQSFTTIYELVEVLLTEVLGAWESDVEREADHA